MDSRETTLERSPLQGSNAGADEPPARRPADAGPRTTLLTRHEGGFAAQGPGFFVWDREASEVIRIAEALQAGRFVGSRSARFLVIEGLEAESTATLEVGV